MLVLLLATILIIAGYFAVQPVASIQPPVDAATFTVGTIGQPRRLDPARAYDTASGTLISNVYETLIFFSDKQVLPPSSTNVSAWGYSDLSQFEPRLAASMPTISSDRKNWTFTIRSGVKFHPWKTAGEISITDQELTSEDVEYTFKRMLVQDQFGAPSWMFCVPGCGYMFFNNLDGNFATNTIEPVGVDGSGERLVASLINDFVTSAVDNVTFHFETAWPEKAVMQIFSQTWGSIVNKDFCIEHGCWNGTFYDGWSTDYRQMPSKLYSPLDQYHSRSKYSPTSPGPNTGTDGDVPCMCGTGPYKYTSWDKTNKKWQIDAFPNYWRGWTGSHVNTVIVSGIDVWPTRKMLFLDGSFDSVSVPRANTVELLLPGQSYFPIEGLTLYYNAPVLSNDIMTFNFRINPQSAYLPKIENMTKPDFFNDVHMRRAFAYSINLTQYLRDAWGDDALHPASWWVKGLVPDYENKDLEPYDLNLTKVEEELKAAGVWETGFEVDAAYILSSDTGMTYAISHSIKDSIESLNEKRPDLPPFMINVIGLDWPTYLDREEAYDLPTFYRGWLVDFADPDNFVRAYMYQQSDGVGIYNGTVNDLINLAFSLPDGDQRNQTYQTLQFMYWYDAWGIPLIQSLANTWFRDWVRGWYYNALYPGLYFYDLYKEVPGQIQYVDLDITR